MRRTRKTSRLETTIAVDRISEFPDSVLVHILSFLEIEDAVRTQVLSKRWQFLWTFLPSLLFGYNAYDDYGGESEGEGEGEDFRVARNTEFVTFVEKTLFSSNCKLKKFEVDFEYDPRFASNVDSWTRFATGKGVQELHLRLWSDAEYELPQLLYDNSSFKELRFSGCWVVPEGNIAWYSLKKLSIGDVELSNDVIERILAGSPVLETLELRRCEGFSRLAVANSCVKKLILRDCLPWDDSELEISAPYLLSLKMSGHLGSNCRLTNISSLVDAVFNCNFACFEQDRSNDYERIQNIVVVFLASLIHVKNLTLGTWAIEVLSIMEAKGLSSPLLNCKCLTLDTKIDKYVLPGIANLFKTTPNVEALIMASSSSSSGLTWIQSTVLLNYNEEQYWTSQKWTYKCLTLHLKNVTISDDLMRYHCDSNLLSFVQFLLRNARVLQKMVISTRSDDRLKECFEAAKKLLSFPRSSPDAAVIFS
ncbi:hypothetical protein RHGRI_037503 [Rhododendron griersonianum]|uniref:F-box domain-containing protein n=1 Tax=Rhododendron griersonianum TaxID=479676 RepID=A0AAV6HVM4_9ERIC|nr:hypothetical protein RHGRI_037503 [Rhododendron griersonianum]